MRQPAETLRAAGRVAKKPFELVRSWYQREAERSEAQWRAEDQVEAAWHSRFDEYQRELRTARVRGNLEIDRLAREADTVPPKSSSIPKRP